MILFALLLLPILYIYYFSFQYKRAFDHLDDGIIFIRRNGKISFANRALIKFFSLDDFHHLYLEELEIKTKKELFKACLEFFQRALSYESEVKETFFYKDGKESFAAQIKIVPIKKRMLMVLIRELDKEKRDFSLGKEFIANATHELRTPIAIIRGFVETLQELKQISDGMLEDIFEKILRSCHRMDQIVKNLLILTDLDHLSHLTKISCDPDSLIRNVVDTCLQRYPNAEIVIKTDSKISSLKGDLHLLEITFSNLIFNAIKYSQASAKVIIEIDENDDYHLFTIKDFGIGIPEENIPYIFDRFYSVNKSLSRKMGGAGLGLSIVKTIIEKHQGFIGVENHSEGGAVFNLMLPKKD